MRGRTYHRGPIRPQPGHRAVRGFVLPFVLIAVAAASIMALAFTTEGLQSLRGQRGAEQGIAAANAVDAALAQALDDFTNDSVWLLPLGVAHRRSVTVNSIGVAVQWQRHQPLVASLRTHARIAGGRRVDAAEREHYRAVWLAPPPVPVFAALAANGKVTGRTGTLVSGSDVPLPTSPCGLARDTLSVPAVAATTVEGEVPGGWPEAPIPAPVDTGWWRELGTALGAIDARVPATTVSGAPRPFPTHRDWSALHWRGEIVGVTGPTRWTGLVVVRGPLIVTGTVHITGLLLLEGAMDASAGQLTVQGAVLAADASATGVRLGARSHLFFDRCAVQMALASVARPTLAPFSLWQSLPRQMR